MMEVAKQRGASSECFDSELMQRILGPAPLCTSSLGGEVAALSGALADLRALSTFFPETESGYGIAFEEAKRLSLCITGGGEQIDDFKNAVKVAFDDLCEALNKEVSHE